MTKGIYNISEGNLMAAHTQVVYIYIEGSDLEAGDIAQGKKHTDKDRKFKWVKYTQAGTFEPEIPQINANTKIIISGHSTVGEDGLFQFSHGDGGLKLTYETLAKAIAEKTPVGEWVTIDLNGCYAGLGGYGKTAYEGSLAAKLFTALVEKGLKPIISVGFGPVVVRHATGKLNRVIILKKPTAFSRAYDNCAAQVYGGDSEKYRVIEMFQTIQNDRKMLFDPRLRGSKGVLKYQAESSQPEIEYPYGEPDEKFGKNPLASCVDQRTVLLFLGMETLFAQRFQDKMEKLRIELGGIFDDFEKECFDVNQKKQYTGLKEFLLTEDYYVDVEIINSLILQMSSLTKKERQILIGKIQNNKILKSLEFDSNEIESLYHYHLEPNEVDFTRGYLQLGFSIVKGEILNYPGPIQSAAFWFLEESIQQKLAIELGKQMVGHGFDDEFVKECIVQAKQMMELYDIGWHCITQGKASLAQVPLDMQVRFILEWGKKQQGQEYDKVFIAKYSQLPETEVRNIGRSHIFRNEDSRISGPEFNRLDQGQQDDLALLVGKECVYGELSEDLQTERDVLINIAKELSLQKPCQSTAKKPREKESSLSLSKFMSGTFFPPFSQTPKSQAQGIPKEVHLVHRSLTRKGPG